MLLFHLDVSLSLAGWSFGLFPVNLDIGVRRLDMGVLRGGWPGRRHVIASSQQEDGHDQNQDKSNHVALLRS
jgi:hypothetical protein